MENRLILSYASDEVPDLSIAFADTELEIRSWNLFAVLLSIGHPVPPIELASRCTLIEASQEFVEFVCCLPNSPISLTTGGLVTVSSAVCVVLQRFLLNSSGGLKVLLPPETVMRDSGRKRAWKDIEITYTRKRRRLRSNVNEKADQADLTVPFMFPDACAKVYIQIGDTVKSIIMNTGSIGASNDHTMSFSVLRGLMDHYQFQLVNQLNTSSSLWIEDISGENSCLSKKPSTASQADDNNKVISLVKAWIDNDSSKANNNSVERQIPVEERDHECMLDSDSHKGNLENLSRNIVYRGVIPDIYVGGTNNLCCNDMTPCSGIGEKASCQEDGEHNIVLPTDVENLRTNEAQIDDLQEEEKTVCGRRDIVCSLPAKLKTFPKVTSSTVQTVSTKTNKGNDFEVLNEQKFGKKDKRSTYVKQKLKSTCELTVHISGRENTKENKEKVPASSVKGQSEPKILPVFDSYIVEEEEGSGGYGTVYKTRRKKDGTMFAVKYPHANANRHHVYNEVKMLERFGGKNFVIKYEGSFKSGNSHCLVLEHVAHDRPEVLKREIDVFQLRWYGYCLFRALASLHKQGVVHRDVKPGNFLFSRKASKGYLIDFNLATDLHQKLGFSGKYKSNNDASSKLVPPPHPELLPPTRNSKYTSSKALVAETHSKMLLFPKNIKKKKDQKDLNIHSVIKSQGADGSGITSAKDATSTKVLSGERFREPIPCKGRKEYLNLVQEAIALQNPEHESTVSTNLVSKRKRVAAPPAKLDNKFMYPTPMPLQSTGFGLLKNKGDGKQRKEGPCVGTKGFRAPEVLLKSTYQGPKVDIWSAGVTLLYFIIGRTPFVGDPDQNIKEIAKLRGSEDLWEVAKLHDRESSFPPELLQLQSLASTKLQDWCKQNTRRPDFLEVIPKSLIDLVDKCLTVNPRSRFSAEEALRHEFFVPCFNELEKHRLKRQKLAHSNSQPLNCQSSSAKNLS